MEEIERKNRILRWHDQTKQSQTDSDNVANLFFQMENWMRHLHELLTSIQWFMVKAWAKSFNKQEIKDSNELIICQ